MDDKYFIPDIEDIRIGYELEKGILRLKPPQPSKETYIECWERFIIKDRDDIMQILTHLPGNIIRVPYLTKEQIEAEGWEVIDDKNPAKFKHPVEVDVQVVYDFENHYLWITIPAEIVKEKIKYRANKYAGYCKSINEFRYISKLLQLNK